MTTYDDELVSVFLRSEPNIKRYFAKVSGSQHEAEDLAQEAWIKLSRNAASASVAPVPYLLRIARTLAIDHKRTKARRLSVQDVDQILSVPDERPNAQAELEDRDQIRWLVRIIDELPERRRQILVGARLEHRSHAELARQFSVSERTIEMELRKALNYCSARLADLNRA